MQILTAIMPDKAALKTDAWFKLLFIWIYGREIRVERWVCGVCVLLIDGFVACAELPWEMLGRKESWIFG